MIPLEAQQIEAAKERYRINDFHVKCGDCEEGLSMGINKQIYQIKKYGKFICPPCLSKEAYAVGMEILLEKE